MEDDVFEVEAIIEKGKGEAGEELYKVKWKGYDESECTWEPLENLNTVQAMVDAFNKEPVVTDTVRDLILSKRKHNQLETGIPSSSESLKKRVQKVRQKNGFYSKLDTND